MDVLNMTFLNFMAPKGPSSSSTTYYMSFDVIANILDCSKYNGWMCTEQFKRI